MCDFNKEHRKNVVIKNGKIVLYTKIVKAVYRCIQSALLWYDLYVNKLKDMGFEINPYDKCTVNKMINVSQCTSDWYVEKNKISHKEAKVVENMFTIPKEKFGELTITKGNSRDVLGMNLRITKEKRVDIATRKQIKEAIEMFGEEIKGKLSTPAAKHLLWVYDTKPLLDQKRKYTPHSVTSKCLYITKRGRPDIDSTVAFLCKRVSKSNEDDWKKLERLLVFLKNTINDKSYIGVFNIESLYTWIDAAYAVHPDMISHTGEAILFRRGMLNCWSGKQNLNTNRKIEAEIVGVSDYLL